MVSLLPVLMGLIAVLLILAMAWMRFRRTRGCVTAPRVLSVRSASRTDVADAAIVSADPIIVMLQAQRRFHALALGFEPSATTISEPKGEQYALMRAVMAVLDSDTLSPRYIPRRPQLLPQLVQSVNDANASSRSIGAIIAQDPVLAGNLLRIGNSPVHRLPGRKVDSIERAVTLVGTDGVRQIISAALLQPVMDATGGHGGRCSGLIWEYSLRVSAAAADYARSVERDDGFAAQLMGLLQGLASVVVMQAAQDEATRNPSLQLSPSVIALLLERCTHAMAARIAAHWELSPTICNALSDGDGPQARAHALGRSLQFARTAGALAMLCHEGEMEDTQALSLLSSQAPAHVLDWVWRRIRQRNE